MKKGKLLLGTFAAVVFMFALSMTTQANNITYSDDNAVIEYIDVMTDQVTDQDPEKKGTKKTEKSEECTTKAESKCCGETKAKSSECTTEKKSTKTKVG